jgi:hypothetical protein
MRKIRNVASGEVIDLDQDKQRKAAVRYLRNNEPGSFQYDSMSPEAIVAQCADQFAKELADLLAKNPDLEAEEARLIAATHWRAALPDITSLRTTLAYIACVAWGAKHGILSGAEVKLMMFTAQTQLTVLRTVREQAGTVPALAGTSAGPGSGELFPSEQLRAPQSTMEASK